MSSQTNRRWVFGKDHHRDYGEGNDCSCYWEEIIDGNNHKNCRDEMEGCIIQKHCLKNRLGIFHFGRINQLSVFDGNKKNELCDKIDNEEEHPLRTNFWEMDLKWSFLSPSPKKFSRTGERKKGKTVKLELHPEGYCRIIESSKNGKDQDCSNSQVWGVGRWKKRPWGVTIVVRPLFTLKSSLDATNFYDDHNDDHDNDYGRNYIKTCSKNNKSLNIIDERTEFIFHANNFHWNGFGSNPKLTQGTILLQKQKRSKSICWWKSTTWAHSSILPVWPEELSEEYDDDKRVANGRNSLGSVYSNLVRFWGILNVNNSNNNHLSTRQKWFRPVVGTFTAKGIMQK